MSRKKTSPNRRTETRLAFKPPVTRMAPVWAVPQRWVKNFVGVFLLPVAWVFTQTFFNVFSKAGHDAEFWMSEEFWFFGLGAALWTLWFFGSIWALGQPRPLRAYVFGHELTHAIWVWMWGGQVSRFEVSREGGFIVTDTHNFWIALAPYFYPLYSLVVVLCFGVASFFCDFTRIEDTFMFMTPLQWLYLLLGATWAFHLSFTIWMIPKGQTDLTYHGTFFSLVIIYLMNLLLVAVMLIVASRHLSFADFGHDLLENTENFAAHAMRWLRHLRAVIMAH